MSQAAVGWMLVISGALKRWNALELRSALEALGVHPKSTRVQAAILVSLELSLGVLLLLNASRLVIGLSLCLIVAFSVALLFLMHFAPGVSCGCLGETLGNDHGVGLVRNGVLAALLGTSWYLAPNEPSVFAGILGLQCALLLLISSQGASAVRALRLTLISSGAR